MSKPSPLVIRIDVVEFAIFICPKTYEISLPWYKFKVPIPATLTSGSICILLRLSKDWGQKRGKIKKKEGLVP